MWIVFSCAVHHITQLTTNSPLQKEANPFWTFFITMQSDFCKILCHVWRSETSWQTWQIKSEQGVPKLQLQSTTLPYRTVNNYGAAKMRTLFSIWKCNHKKLLALLQNSIFHEIFHMSYKQNFITAYAFLKLIYIQKCQVKRNTVHRKDHVEPSDSFK